MSFRHSTRDIDFDVYLKISPANVVHLFSRATGLDYKRLAQYINKGVAHLHIHPDDEAAYKAFIARTTESIFNDPKTTQEKKIATLINMTEQNISEIFSQFSISSMTADDTHKLIKNYVDTMLKKPETLAMILKMVCHGDYLYYHSIAVSILSMFIAKASGQFNQRTLELVGFGGFLHDIGSTQIPKEIVCSPDDLTEKQWGEMHAHTAFGLKMVESTQNIPEEVRYIIYQHHEEPGGNGYPNGIRGPVIYYPAKIVALADGFNALISNRPFRPAYSTVESIRIIQQAVGKYDRGLVAVLTSIFADQMKPKYPKKS
jgi:putative nucleotidyltransferase with HDIG domain